ncbi:hypothetical protein [Salinivibrio sp. YCSC6]|uniref:hypothetical protein n=1 Tax=Salinivibrio sp. YCSC6 TaxID=2003370 RepID=UPI0010A79BB5|nr:hypothetical protein [Salinivibrio sp. YCSC6]QCF35716.1 hypothetical protein E8E00_05810 [Salinivibrio sp. YCSC6]
MNNVVSGAVNLGTGIRIGIALAAIPVTGGLSIALVAGGTLFWGLYGGEISDKVGMFAEEVIFD